MSQYKARPRLIACKDHHPSVVRPRNHHLCCSPEGTFIATAGPHARTRAGRGCRPHGLSLYMSAPTLFTGFPPKSPLIREEKGASLLYRTWALDVSDDRSGLVVHELDADLSHTTTRTYPACQIVVPPSMYKISKLCLCHQIRDRGDAPVRPRTRVTLTSLTGCLEASIFSTWMDFVS